MNFWRLSIVAALLARVPGCMEPATAAPGGPATQVQVNQGTQPYMWVTPATLSSWAGGVGGDAASNFWLARQDIQAMGQLPYLVDMAAFCVTNGIQPNTTFAGKPITLSGVISNSCHGAYFRFNGQMSFPISLATSNTICIVYDMDYNNPIGYSGVLFEAMNTNTMDAQTVSVNMGNGWQDAFLQNATGTTPSVVSTASLTQMQWVNGYSYDERPMSRHVLVISTDGAGNMVSWDNGLQNTWYTGGTGWQNFATPPLNTMTMFSLGQLVATNGMAAVTTNGFEGTIESVQLYNKYADTNLIRTCIMASDELQPWTRKRIWVTDSLGVGQNYTSNLVSDVDGFKGFDNAISLRYTQGGTSIFMLGWYAALLAMNPPHGKITSVETELAMGVNDISLNNNSFGQTLTSFSNLVLNPQLGDPRFQLDIWDVQQVYTNAAGYGSGFTWSAANTATTYAVDAWWLTNRSYIRNVYQRSALVTQAMLSPLASPQLSTDGVHFNNTVNGNGAYQMVAGLALAAATGVDPYVNNGGALNYNGSFSGSAMFTNLSCNMAEPVAVYFNWAQIPPFSATATNYWVGNWTNGTVCAIYSNSATTYAIKQLAP